MAKDGRLLRELTAAEMATSPPYSFACCSGDRLNYAVICLAVAIGVYVVVDMVQTFALKQGK